jgi:hypothetical protein
MRLTLEGSGGMFSQFCRTLAIPEITLYLSAFLCISCLEGDTYRNDSFFLSELWCVI